MKSTHDQIPEEHLHFYSYFYIMYTSKRILAIAPEHSNELSACLLAMLSKEGLPEK